MKRTVLFAAALLIGLPAASVSQEEQEQEVVLTAEDLSGIARDTDEALTFARALSELVKRSHAQADEQAGLVQLLTEFASGDNGIKRAIAVDAVKSLPSSARETMVGVLTDLAGRAPDGPATRLYVRGLGQNGDSGLAALAGLVNAGSLSGDAEALARVYLRPATD
jgi:hypothetical protein